jgi:phosphatidylserine/phosphatidylglycerophosphate/cardiolipin synthase-like enzyme
MDSSPVADTTLYKMVNAARRGVHVILFVDYVQCWINKDLVKMFQEAGGKFMVLNPPNVFQWVRNFLAKDAWRRHHEKLIVSDSKSIIGSSNI